MTSFGKRTITRSMARLNRSLHIREFVASDVGKVERDLLVHFFNGKDGWRIACAVSLIVVLVSYFRMYLGVDFTDEALYSAIPYRFILGDRPFLDELNLTQTSSLLVVPFVRLWVWFRGSSEGIILFNRHLCFALSTVVAGFSFLCFRRFTSSAWALLAATLFLTYVPYSVFGPGYNALGSAFLILGIFAGQTFHGVRGGVAVACFHSLACFAYPTLALSACTHFAWRFFRSSHRIGFASAYLATGIIVPLSILLFWKVELLHLVSVARYVAESGANSGHGWNLPKVASLFLEFWQKTSYKPLLLVLFLAITQFQKPLALAFALNAVLPVLLFFSNRAISGGTGIAGHLTSYALCAPFFWWLRGRFRIDLLAGVWFPCVIAGAAMGWSSNNGIQAAAIPLLPAALVTAYFQMQPFGRFHRQWFPSGEVIAMVPLLVFAAATVYAKKDVYQDSPLSALDTRIFFGPFQGLFTTPAKATFLRELSNDVQLTKGDSKSILFVPHFPAGYLMTKLPPAAPSVWDICSPGTFDRCRRFFHTRSREGALTVLVKKLPYHSAYAHFSVSSESPLGQMIVSEHASVLVREAYEIFSTRR